MSNEVKQNLFRSGPEARKRGQKGGVASGESRRYKRQLKENLETLLFMPMKPGESTSVEKVQSFASLKGINITVQDAMLIAQVQKALKGDTRAAEFIRDTLGQKPTDTMDMRLTLPVFFEGEDEIEE